MGEADQSIEALKKKLDEHYQWPAVFPFKFIVKKEQVPDVEALFPGEIFSTKPSANGKYMGMTLEKSMDSSGAVLAVYEKVKSVPGLLSL